MDSVNVIIQTLQTLHICVSMARGFARIIVTVYVSHATGSVKIIQSNYGLCKDYTVHVSSAMDFVRLFSLCITGYELCKHYTVHVSLAMNFVKTIQSMYHWLWTL